MVADGRPILQNSQCVALLVSFEFWSQVLGFETYCIEGNESKTRKTKSWCLQNEEPWNYWNSTGFPTQSSIFCEGMEGAKQGGHMVILVVPGRNLSEELTLNLEFSPIVPWQQIQDPSASGWKLHMLWTNLIGQEIWQRKTDSKCSCHIFKYICIQYIMYSIYINIFICVYQYVFANSMDTGCQVFSILLLFLPTCFSHLKVAEFSEEFPKNYYDQAVEGVGALATYVDGLRVSICPTYPW